MLQKDIENSKEFKYRLYFHENIEDPGKSVPDLTLVQRTTTELKKNGTTYDIDLNDISFERKVYQPGCITVELQINFHSDANMDGTGSAFSQDDLKTFLLQRRVTLGLQSEESLQSETAVAENYYVHEISPRVVRDAKKSILFVTLSIFSMDKLMTLNKYSKAYVVKRLGADVLTNESKVFGFKSALVKVNTENMQSLLYKQSELDTNPSEFVQPYLVQYNESFYDFMARTSNRCGEFLLFENGQLILGLPKQDKPVDIKNYASVSYQNISSAPLTIKAFTRDSVKGEKDGEFNDSPVDNDKTGYPVGTFGTDYAYNSELAHDDYIFPMVKDKFSSYGRALGMYDAKSAIRKLSLDLFSRIVSNAADPWDGAKEIAIDMGTAYGLELYSAKGTAAAANAAGNKVWIDGFKDKKQQTDGTRTVPFATVSPDGWVKLAYYSRIRSEQEAQEKKVIRIDMGANYAPVKLGGTVTVDQIPGKYVVIEIQQNSRSQKNAQNGPQPAGGNAGQPRIDQSQVIYAIPVISDGSASKARAVPPVLQQPVIRTSGPQTAFIVSNGDPKKQGRVRIAFPWQTVGDQLIKDELNAAKAELAKATDADKKAKDRKEKAQQLLNRLKAQNKDLEAVQSALEKEPDASKHKELFEKQKEANKARQEANQKRIEQIDSELDETKANSLGSQLKLTNGLMNREVNWKDGINGFSRALGVSADKLLLKGTQLLLKGTQKKLLERKAKLEGEKKSLTEANEQLKATEKNLAEFPGEGSALNFVKQKQAAITSQQIAPAKQELDAASKSADDTKKQRDAAQGVVNKLTKKWMVLLTEVASPWVRVAMPMATEEGGMYFKPRPGDEVLVNFDSDNVERPYVVGSLYSKEHVDPDHDMIIKSPSGQKIQFKIAKNDKDFIQSLTPMLGKLGTYIPAVGDKLTFGSDARKLCGGITLTDEFGMFSVDMSSNRRSVTVKSPFGSVGVSAFTGITISAPNGDVKIKGKNVSIEAGNNLKLLSGANVTDANSVPDKKEKAKMKEDNMSEDEKLKQKERLTTKMERWATAAVGLATWGAGMGVEKGIAKAQEKMAAYTGRFEIVDMQLLRCLCEVFLRPIEGTLLVKSKNYLMLEAGKGKAEVSIERYSNEWQKFMGVEKDADKERFYAKTTAYIKRIDQKVAQFCQDYDKLVKEAFQMREAYIVYMESIYKKDCYSKAPMVKADGFKNADKEFKKNDKDFKGGTIDMSGIKYEHFKGQEKGRHFIKGLDGEILTSVKEVKAYLKPAVEGFGKSSWALHRHALAFKTLFSDETIKAVNQATLGTASHKDTKWIDDAFKKAVFGGSDSDLELIIKSWHSLFGDLKTGPKDCYIDPVDQNERDWFMNPKIVKRKLVADFLMELYKSEGNMIPAEVGIGPKKPGKYFTIGYKEVDFDLLDKNWADVAALAPKKNIGFFKKMLGFVGKAASTLALDWTGAKAAWKPMIDPGKPKMGWERKVWNGQNGKIIFSDKKNATYTINGENIETWKHADLGNEANLKKAITNIK